MKLYNRILAEPAPGLPGIPSRGGSPPCPMRPCTTCSPTTPGHRDQILARGAKSRGEIPLGEVTVLAPLPRPGQDILCLGMNYRAHKAEAEQFDPAAFTRQGQAVYFAKRAQPLPRPGGAHPRPL